MGLAAGVEIQEKVGKVVKMKLAAVKVYKGGILKINAAGYAAPAAAEAGAVVAGICMETVDNSAGSAGDKEVLVARKGLFLLPCSTVAQADVGAKVYASADNLVSETQASNEQEIGTMLQLVSASSAWIEIG